MARSWLTAEAEKVRERTAKAALTEKRPRRDEVRELQAAGLDRSAIAEVMGIGAATVAFYQGEIKAIERDRIARYEGRGSVGQTAAMAAVYPDRERREWILQQMALRDELIAHKERRR